MSYNLPSPYHLECELCGWVSQDMDPQVVCEQARLHRVAEEMVARKEGR